MRNVLSNPLCWAVTAEMKKATPPTRLKITGADNPTHPSKHPPGPCAAPGLSQLLFSTGRPGVKF